ncbi:MAG TPA: bifunctional [glutamate--ammonia ligase]-adenylyl-L-tyrosine phosphorylase/[glutamate--ammonia-ligase] adenylyltransferase [Candidatus Eisenbacteria bacterium]|nr:bifunctional [glutamate--ammonia ligase]-adenylyl-L-tyrosine phosphorylase/[glutamate--ammonia-ligase] adenylyltransferase [Candidatus Eisenbacteria bacterium]
MTDLQRVAAPLRRKLERLIQTSPSPALAQSNLAALLESGGSDSLADLNEAQLALLIRLLGASAYLSNILTRQGPSWPELFLAQIKAGRKTREQHLAELEPAIARCGSFDEICALLRRHKQREYLRIGARDLLASTTLEETVRELTALAEATLEAAYRSARAEVEQEFGCLNVPATGATNRFVVIGMGKLGGAELNFSSDIDVVFLYESDEGESSGGVRGKTDPRNFFTGVGKKIIQAMGKVTEDGFVFRIDLRLRPMGASGPLVQSVDSAMIYYESWGQCWERSALIKARPVAGERELGAAFLQEVEPFVYRRYLDYTTIDELRHMKARIERELLNSEQKHRNIKLGYGGIREVEFFTQALQLVNGGYEPALRVQNTLEALALLARYKFISAQDKQILSDAYRFLRQVEHKVQMVQEAHGHSIPVGAEAETALALRLGYSARNRAAARTRFWSDHREHTNAVRTIFDRLFHAATKEIRDEGASGIGTLWQDLDHREIMIRELRKTGFTEPERAYDNLLAIRDGEVYAPPSPRRLKVMRVLGPALITEIANSSAPDQALLNLARFSHRIGGRTGFLSLLAENPRTMRLLITLFAESQFLSDLFVNRPELIDTLIRADLTRIEKTKREMLLELREAMRSADDLESRLNVLRRYKTEEFIRIGLHDLGGALALEAVLEQLSCLAEACLQAALDLVFVEMEEKFGAIPRARFAILAMGKLGGRELDYNSDLDLIFIYDALEDAESGGGSQGTLGAHEFFVRLGQKLITYLSAPTEEGVAYKIDMQLRPSGKSGPLVSSLEAFRQYHKTSSLLWERQALIKARAVAGDAALGRTIEKVVESFAYGRGLDAQGIREIHRLRMRMERELAREDGSRFDLKKGRGGLVDIEFLAQMLQLAHGHFRPQVRQRQTLEALKQLRELEILNAAEHTLLSDGYRFLRQLDHRLRLERDQTIDGFEREPERLNSIAQALGYDGKNKGRKARPGERLLEDYEIRREKIRACYEKHFLVSGKGDRKKDEAGVLE